MGERKRIPLGIFTVLLLISTSSFQLLCASDDADDAIFYESFDEAFEGRWIVSVKDEYNGVWKHAKSEGHDDYGLLVSEKARKYAIVKELDEPVNLKDETDVLQFETRLQNGLECGGAYLKYLRPQEAGWKPKEFDNECPYSILFGPDKCGATNKVHFIFKHKNPKSGEYVEHHLKYPPSVPSDKLSHVYTAILKPDNELKVLIDGEEKKTANFLSSEDFEPPLIPPKTIPDPDDKKPEDWDERAKIPDPDAVKPDNWCPTLRREYYKHSFIIRYFHDIPVFHGVINQASKNQSQCSKKYNEVSCQRRCLGALDANFFNDKQIEEIDQGAKEFNIPIITANQKLVASENGGLHYPSPLIFNADWDYRSVHSASKTFNYPSISRIQRPKFEEDIAFMSVLELGELIKTKQISSQELTQIFLQRLKKYNPILEAVITYTEELAHKQAKEADELLSQGVYLGPLHGIPYGLKDIISVPKYRTTWGSKSFKNQVIDMEAWVYKRLKSAGAVLVAKLVSGSLAYDDIWFGGRTRNPWNIEEFSTGSSAGPAASTSAGLVPFAIGSETAGSITYPAARCGVTALRPTFGTVGRTGVMSLSESLDKLGPFCRSAIDCAVVLDIIRGRDPDDLSSKESSLDDPFLVDITKLTVGYLDDAEMEVVNVLASKGVKMVPFKLNYTVDSVQGILNFTMDADMLAHFDEWQRSGQDNVYEAQEQWPTELRRARLIPAVDYIQAQRARGRLIKEIRESFTVDAFIGNATDWEKVCVGNLVGLPVIVVPTGFTNITNPPPGGSKRRSTVTTGIYASPNRDHIALALAMAYQSVTNHHKQRPPINNLGPDDKIPDPPTVIHPARILYA